MALLWVGLLCGLFCSVYVSGTVDQPEVPTFIYHSNKNLLLATTSNSCYYIRIDTATSPQMNNEASRLDLEHRIIEAIWDNVGVSDVTLQTVRDDFNDLLADFHCLDKHVHELALPVEPPTTATPTTHPTTHHTTHHTTHATHAPHATHPPTHAQHATHPPTHPIGPQPASTELALHDCNDPRHPDRFQLMADVAFLLDVSTSVTDQEFKHVKEFLKAMTSHYRFGNHDVQLSVTEYDRYPHTLFDFNTYHNNDVKGAIDQLREIQSAHNHDQTYTGAALHFIRDNVFTAAAGDRPEAPNVLVIISDGSNVANQDHQELIQQAQLLHNDGVQIIVIGIGDSIQSHQSELAHIANDHLSFVHLNDYKQLHDQHIADHINTVICTEVYAHTSG